MLWHFGLCNLSSRRRSFFFFFFLCNDHNILAWLHVVCFPYLNNSEGSTLFYQVESILGRKTCLRSCSGVGKLFWKGVDSKYLLLGRTESRPQTYSAVLLQWKAVIGGTQGNECASAPVRFYLEKQAKGHSLKTSTQPAID